MVLWYSCDWICVVVVVEGGILSAHLTGVETATDMHCSSLLYSWASLSPTSTSLLELIHTVHVCSHELTLEFNIFFSRWRASSFENNYIDEWPSLVSGLAAACTSTRETEVDKWGKTLYTSCNSTSKQVCSQSFIKVLPETCWHCCWSYLCLPRNPRALHLYN